MVPVKVLQPACLVNWNKTGLCWSVEIEAFSFSDVEAYIVNQVENFLTSTSHLMNGYYIPNSTSPILKVLDKRADFIHVTATWCFSPLQ